MNPAPSYRKKTKERLFTVSQAAQYLGVSTKTLRRWDKKRILLSLRTNGGQRRYYEDLLQKFKTQQQLTRAFVRKQSSSPVPKRRVLKPMIVAKPKPITTENFLLPIILFIFLLLTTLLYFF